MSWEMLLEIKLFNSTLGVLISLEAKKVATLVLDYIYFYDSE